MPRRTITKPGPKDANGVRAHQRVIDPTVVAEQLADTFSDQMNTDDGICAAVNQLDDAMSCIANYYDGNENIEAVLDAVEQQINIAINNPLTSFYLSLQAVCLQCCTQRTQNCKQMCEVASDPSTATDSNEPDLLPQPQARQRFMQPTAASRAREQSIKSPEDVETDMSSEVKFYRRGTDLERMKFARDGIRDYPAIVAHYFHRKHYLTPRGFFIYLPPYHTRPLLG
ncbi:hypothetical protein EMPG_11709 [Blastomyces silverae]|uniref:Uncharacterized protein n=1 Tax=Blastomyces silverae TaxID=2060906 RepID=A0A0H1BPV5_9EURO|nr:hypothetical protein EMPG_11709 [Blastomyces silverae]